MRIEAVNAQVFAITGMEPRLDPVTVILLDLGPGFGRIIVQCCGEAWTATWGAMGSRTVREFVSDTDADYLATKLAPPRRQSKAAESYLSRVAGAVIEAIRLPVNEGDSRNG